MGRLPILIWIIEEKHRSYKQPQNYMLMADPVLLAMIIIPNLCWVTLSSL